MQPVPHTTPAQKYKRLAKDKISGGAISDYSRALHFSAV